jgi:hypothetical protein
METFTLVKEIETLTSVLQREVFDFVEFIKVKYQQKQPLKEREFGFAKGKVKLHEDFDAPLDEFKDYI